MARDVASTLKSAIQQLEKDRDRIQGQIDSLKRILAANGSPSGGNVVADERPRRGRRRMSAKERAAVGKRMRTYWAKRRAAKKQGKTA